MGEVMQLVQGIGINDIPGLANRRNQTKDSQVYIQWKAILRRVQTEPRYAACTIHPDWHKLSGFKKWVDSEGGLQGRQVDKDIRIPGNKVYGPDTCLLVSKSLNMLLNNTKKGRGKYPRGVYYIKANNNFCARFQDNGKVIHLGVFDTEWEAAAVYRIAKSNQVRNVALQQTDPRIREGLNRHAVYIELGLDI